MYTVEITDLAEADIAAVLAYIRNHLKAPKAALTVFEELEKKVVLLEKTPKSHPCVQDDYLKQQGVRWIPVKNYMLFYRLRESEKKVTVLRFLYGRRSWSSLIGV